MSEDCAAPQRRCRRTKMQCGCIKRNSRKRGPEVWQFCWSEIGPDGKRHHHKKILGTVEQYPDENAARRAVVGLVSEINAGTRPMNPSAITVGQPCDHFEQRELTKDNSCRSPATQKIYQAYFTRCIHPPSPTHTLPAVTPIQAHSSPPPLPFTT